MRDYANGIEASPERLAEVEDRLAAIDRLKRKYGPTLDDVIKQGEELERKLGEMENKDAVLHKLGTERLANSADNLLVPVNDTTLLGSWRKRSNPKSTNWR